NSGFINQKPFLGFGFTPQCFLFKKSSLELFLFVTKFGCTLKLLLLHSPFLLFHYITYLFFHITDFTGNLHAGEPFTRSGLVDNIDSLVRKEAIGDIALGKLYCRFYGFFGICDLVMILIAVTQSG